MEHIRQSELGTEKNSISLQNRRVKDYLPAGARVRATEGHREYRNDVANPEVEFLGKNKKKSILLRIEQ